MAERQFGPYRLVRQIAVGGMAEIHLAKTKGIAGFEKYVALKMIHPNFAEDDQFIQMLVDEAKIAVQLAHGNIAQTFDLGRVGDTYYITMEYVDGSDLYKLLRRASEQDIEMPLDICAFVGKEVASALDHAHRKRDHTGVSLGIVHRDVSPQNVLVSYAGEVKLVDFGIAKATMKARQTAAGVIKGKYYYMSPEQAWGDPIDFRSDIFSAGIVLYEMITGQMLYLEEDLHKLLDMARKADIAPPSRLRKGVPPQLERIVMHALHKVPGERYQSAGDFATDLERFLHAYSPVFTSAKLSQILRNVVGEPMHVADEDPEIEMRGGAMSSIDQSQLAHADEIRDENSMIFHVDSLEKPTAPKVPTPVAGVPVAPPKAPVAVPKIAPQARPAPVAARKAQDVSQLPQLEDRGPLRGVAKLPARAPAPAKARHADEETRELSAPPGGPNDDLSGLLQVQPPRRAAPKPNTPAWDHSETHPGDGDPAGDDEATGDEDLENIGERTMITAPGFMASAPPDTNASEDEVDYGGVDATMITAAPTQRPESDTDVHANRAPEDDLGLGEEDDGPTISRDFREAAQKKKPAVTQTRKAAQPPPAALAAKIQAPTVSALHKPRASRKTPPGGVPAQNALQAIVGAQAPAPMPAAPRNKPPTQPPPIPPQAAQQPYYQQQPFQQPAPPPPPQYQQPQTGYMADASGMPMGIPTPPGTPAYQPQPYQYPPGYQQPLNPASMYQGNVYGAPPPQQPLSLTGQLRLSEVDEIPAQYRLGGKKASWVVPALVALVAIGVAAAITFYVVRSSREDAQQFSSIHVESAPSGAEITFDGKLVGKTPASVDQLELGSSHSLKLTLDKYRPYEKQLEIPRNGVELSIQAQLKPVTGKLVINTSPKGAEVLVNGQARGRTPVSVTDLDVGTAKKLELRLKDYEPYVQDLVWPESGEIDVDAKLKKP